MYVHGPWCDGVARVRSPCLRTASAPEASVITSSSVIEGQRFPDVGVICSKFPKYGSFPGGASGKDLTCQCRRCKSFGFDPWVEKTPLGEEMATHSSILAWEILQRSLMGYSPWERRVRHSWSNLAHSHTPTYKRVLFQKPIHKYNLFISPTKLSQVPSFYRQCQTCELTYMIEHANAHSHLWKFTCRSVCRGLTVLSRLVLRLGGDYTGSPISVTGSAKRDLGPKLLLDSVATLTSAIPLNQTTKITWIISRSKSQNKKMGTNIHFHMVPPLREI